MDYLPGVSLFKKAILLCWHRLSIRQIRRHLRAPYLSFHKALIYKFSAALQRIVTIICSLLFINWSLQFEDLIKNEFLIGWGMHSVWRSAICHFFLPFSAGQFSHLPISSRIGLCPQCFCLWPRVTHCKFEYQWSADSASGPNFNSSERSAYSPIFYSMSFNVY